MKTAEQMRELIGHRFPGGRYRIEHWENFLLTDCTGAEQLPDGVVHPIALFHVPILGAGTSITKLFELGGAKGAGSVGLEGYDWEYDEPLREDVEYRIEGGIDTVERKVAENGQPYDAVAYSIDLFDGDRHVARDEPRRIRGDDALRVERTGRDRESRHHGRGRHEALLLRANKQPAFQCWSTLPQSCWQ